MPSTRRLGVESSETRARLIEAASQIVRQEGAAAVTARRLAEEVGLQRHIVHYYFGTIEDLFVAVVRRDTERTREWLEEALASNEPLSVIWRLGSSAAATTLEFAALATRHQAVRDALKASSEEFRRTLTVALQRHCELRGIEPALPPAAVTITLQSIAYTLSIERLLGIGEGHEAMMSVVDRYLHDPGGGDPVANVHDLFGL